jgi:hypothetical protein
MIDDLTEYFTPDAWSLVKTFFSDLQAKLIESGIPTAQQDTIVAGLSDYISEFVDDHKNRERINYESALILLREIGSPTDIILTLDPEKLHPTKPVTDVKVARKSQQICSKCQYPNTPDAVFCENCGRKIESTDLWKERIIQESVDHTYLVSFIVIYALLGVLTYLINPFSSSNQLERTALSLVVSIIPAMFLALIAGAILDSFMKDRKSLKFRYNKILNQFEEVVSWGFLFVFLASMIFGLLAIFGFVWSLLVAIILFITSFIWLVVAQGNKPQEIPYITLLTTKRMFDGLVQEKLTKINLYGGTVVVMLVVVWNFIIYNLITSPPLTIEGAIIVSIFQITAILLGLNGYLMMYYYSWSQVNRYLDQKSEIIQK